MAVIDALPTNASRESDQRGSSPELLIRLKCRVAAFIVESEVSILIGKELTGELFTPVSV